MLAAGTIVQAADGRILFLRRSDAGDHPGEWCFPGGKVEDGEDAATAAAREMAEETGHAAEGEPDELMTTSNDEGVTYTTFVGRVEQPFAPVMADGEHTESVWAKPDDAPSPMHPGAQLALDRFAATELGVAQMIADGRLTSPQRVGNFHLFDMRITGTGVAHRESRNEWVYRRPSDYLTPEFLARCGGLPVIMEHPADLVLDSDEFGARVVGTMLLPRVQGEEVWGVAKVFDDATAKMLQERQLSTSPGVVLAGAGDDKRVGMSDGSTLLIEGKPSLLDHLAICELGVWDKGGDPTGVRSDQLTGDAAMAEKTEDEMAAEAKTKADAEEKAKADAEVEEAKKKADSELHGRFDAMFGKIDSLCSRMDALEGKARGEPGEDTTEEEAESLENEAIGALETAQGMEAKPEALAADKQRACRMADAARRRADSARRIVEKRKADEKARADSAARTGLKDEILKDVDSRLASVKSTIPTLPTEAERAAYAQVQARADAVAVEFGEVAGRPLSGETLLDYRKRMVAPYKKHNPAWKDIDLNAIGDAASFGIAEDQIYASAKIAARNPMDLPDGTLREVQKTDRQTGRITTEFYGSPLAWMAPFMSQRGRLRDIGVRKDN